MATIRDVARRAGVSHTAVSAVINGNGKGTVGPEKQKRILEAIKELGYKPSRVARQLATGKSNIIAVCFGVPFPQVFQDPSNSAMVAAVGGSVYSDGYHLLVASVGDSIYTDGDHTFVTSTGRQGLEQVLGELSSQGVGGVVVVGPIESQKSVLAAIDECGIATVCMDSHREFSEASTVDVDYAAAMRQGVEYLASQGHRRISYVTPAPSHQSLVDRMTSFCAVLQEQGISMTEHSILVLGHERVESAVSGALGSENRPTAIIAATAAYGAAAANAVASCGLHVPDDVSLIVFDACPPSAAGAGVVSVIRTDPQMMGSEAADILKKIMAGEIIKPVNIRIPADLVLCPSQAPTAEDAVHTPQSGQQASCSGAGECAYSK